MSAILGFGFATLFRQVCKGKDCYIFSAPPLEDVENKIFKYDNKCYRYKLQQKECNKANRIVQFE